jgi:hypothetical protein
MIYSRLIPMLGVVERYTLLMWMWIEVRSSGNAKVSGNASR